MKKILASLFVAAAAICSTSAANAQTIIPPVTSVHSGNIPPTCTITKKDGTLSSTSNITSTINSTNAKGFFEIKCNSTHALKVELLEGVKPGTVHSSYVEEFKLTGAPNDYDTLNATEFSSGTITRSNLVPTSINGYQVAVEAQGRVTPPNLLPYGANGDNSYQINVQATLTP